MTAACSVADCSRAHYAKGFCSKHYARHLRHGIAEVDNRTSHGNSRRSGKTPEYVAWLAMKDRCSATEGRDFETYGARGIGICERWLSFDLFLEDMGPKPSPEHSLGRENNNLGYLKGNCRWETSEQQNQNTRRSMIWIINGEKYASCRAAAIAIGVDNRTIRKRVKAGVEGYSAIKRY
jgi:hypothetical protein